MRVSDVLASKGSGVVHTISPHATVATLVDTLAELGIGALVVSEDDETMLGIVSERDIVRRLAGGEQVLGLEVAAIMTSDVRVCAPDDTFASLMAVMTEHRVRHVPVLDDGRLVGVLSIGDAVKHRMEQLEFERDQLSSYVSGG
jgi:CBS domain-containing protein